MGDRRDTDPYFIKIIDILEKHRTEIHSRMDEHRDILQSHRELIDENASTIRVHIVGEDKFQEEVKEKYDALNSKIDELRPVKSTYDNAVAFKRVTAWIVGVIVSGFGLFEIIKHFGDRH